MNFLYELFTGKNSFLLILLCVYIGFVAACFLALYDKRLLGNFVRKLISMDATSKEKAVTLKEAGFENKRSITSALRGKGAYLGLIFEAKETVELDEEQHAVPIYRESIDEEHDRFYIPEALKYRADVRFERKGTHIMAVVVAIIAFAVLFLFLAVYSDKIMEFVKGILKSAQNI